MNCLRSLRAALAPLLAAASLLAACGGVDSGGTGQTVENTSTGRLTGFGSIFVNEIRFDDAHATIVDDDGVPRSRADLRLGMVVDVQGELQGNSGNGVARSVQFGHEIAGPVESVDAANLHMTVLGQLVRVDTDTLFGGYPGGLPDVQAGQLVEVSAFQDATSGTYTATRIERKTALAQYRLRGRIGSLANLPARSFMIGNALIDYSGVAAPSLPTLVNGLPVRVTLVTTPVSGRWIASSVRTLQRNLPDSQDAELEGYVSSYSNSASFQVAGVPVDASTPGLTVRRGNLSDLANGARVEVEGQMRAGVLLASRLTFKRGGEQEFELHGPIESVDTSAQRLVVRGVSVAWTGSTVFAAGNVGTLAPGIEIEVKGSPTDGVRIQARSIRFER